METKKLVAIFILVSVGGLFLYNTFKKSKIEEYKKPDSQSKLEFVLKDQAKQNNKLNNGIYTYTSFDDVELEQYFYKPDFTKIYEYKIGSSQIQKLEVKYIYKDEVNGYPQRVVFYRGRANDENLPIGKAMFYQAYFYQPIKNQNEFDSLINKTTQELAFKNAPKDYNNVSIHLKDKNGNTLKSESVEGKIKNPNKY